MYLAAYAVYFLFSRMKIGDFSNDASYLIYFSLCIVCYGCAAGAVAFNASYYFVAKIYSNIRSD